MATAVIYARLSRDYAGTGAGVDRQLEDGRKLAKMRDWPVVEEFVDNDLSAAGKRRRPGFEALLQAITTGRAGVVIAWTLDRLTRNRRDTLRLIETCQQAEATVALVRGSEMDMSTPSGRMVAELLASVARAEIEIKADRQTRAGRQRAEHGKPPARRAFGYRTDGTIDPTEGPAVQELFAKLLAGATVNGLTKWLNDTGHTTTTGRPWIRSGVRALLLNPRYAALRVYHGDIIGPGEWQPLISEDTYQAARVLLTDPARARTRPARRHLGGGLYRCWCGAKVRTNYSVHGTRTYECNRSKHMSRSAEPIDEFVTEVLLQRLRRPDIIELTKSDTDSTKARKLRDDAVGLRERLSSLGVDYAEGKLTADQVKTATRHLQDKLTAIESQLADLGRRSAAAAIAGHDDPGAAWLELSLDQQRAVLDSLLEVTVLRGSPGRAPFDPKTVKIKWRKA